jgi:hypothetical protein
MFLVRGALCCCGRYIDHSRHATDGAMCPWLNSRPSYARILARSMSDHGLPVSRDIANGWIQVSAAGRLMRWRKLGRGDETRVIRSDLSNLRPD